MLEKIQNVRKDTKLHKRYILFNLIFCTYINYNNGRKFLAAVNSHVKPHSISFSPILSVLLSK